ncbi:MAG: PhnM protein [Alphaproteobacteria bacterium]|nr:MAG: PhnM protein [Alphaproteobacteria bacterium]
MTNPELLELLDPQLNNPRLRLLSLMDHTPGQRQTMNLERFRERLVAGGKEAVEIDESLAQRTAWRDQSAAPRNRSTVVAVARKYAIPLASHDDATIEHVDEAHDNGAIIAEFPVSIEAAVRAREVGMKIFMGGPNFVRGSSHSGNLSARECATAGLLDGITSDYIPLSMLRSAFMLAEPPYNWPIQDAIATVARTPALACGLTDRGEIAIGQRADFLRIRRSSEGWPTPREVWREGRRVA